MPKRESEKWVPRTPSRYLDSSVSSRQARRSLDEVVRDLNARLEQRALASTSAASEVDISTASTPVTAPEVPPTTPGFKGTPPVAGATCSMTTTGTQTTLHLNEDDVVLILPPGGGRLV